MVTMFRGVAVWALAALLMLAAPEAMAQTPSAEGESNGFRAIALITADPDWLEKFENAGPDGPDFEVSPTLEVGQTARLLLFFSGAFPSDGKVNVLCDLRILQDGQVAFEQEPTVCSQADDPGDASSLMLADSTLVITPTEDDLGKELEVQVGITDGIRGEFVPLTLSMRYWNGG